MTPNQPSIKKLGHGSNFLHYSQLFSNLFGEIQFYSAQPKAEIKIFNRYERIYMHCIHVTLARMLLKNQN